MAAKKNVQDEQLPFESDEETADDTPAGERPSVQLFSDGACLGNPGPGGWAYILRHPSTGKERERSGGDDQTTNNRMELMAVIKGLEALSEPTNVELVGDSQYVLKGISEWMPGWKKKGWKKKGGPIMNLELWQRLDKLVMKHNVKVTWVRGHTGHIENERCDELASAEAAQRK